MVLHVLQTPYAFIIFDNERGLVFAARDPKVRAFTPCHDFFCVIDTGRLTGLTS